MIRWEIVFLDLLSSSSSSKYSGLDNCFCSTRVRASTKRSCSSLWAHFLISSFVPSLANLNHEFKQNSRLEKYHYWQAEVDVLFHNGLNVTRERKYGQLQLINKLHQGCRSLLLRLH